MQYCTNTHLSSCIWGPWAAGGECPRGPPGAACPARRPRREETAPHSPAVCPGPHAKTPAGRDQSLALRKTRTETPKRSENKPPPTHTAATPQTSWGTQAAHLRSRDKKWFLWIHVSLFLCSSLLVDYKQKLCAACKTKMKSKRCIYFLIHTCLVTNRACYSKEKIFCLVTLIKK